LQNRRKRTLIIVRRELTEPNTALAGVTQEISFARLRVSIATFNEERELSRPLGLRELGSMGKARGRCEIGVSRGL